MVEGFPAQAPPPAAPGTPQQQQFTAPQIDLSGVKTDRPAYPPNTYAVVVNEADTDMGKEGSKSDGLLVARLTLEITDGEYAGGQLFTQWTLGTKADPLCLNGAPTLNDRSTQGFRLSQAIHANNLPLRGTITDLVRSLRGQRFAAEVTVSPRRPPYGESNFVNDLRGLAQAGMVAGGMSAPQPVAAPPAQGAPVAPGPAAPGTPMQPAPQAPASVQSAAPGEPAAPVQPVAPGPAPQLNGPGDNAAPAAPDAGVMVDCPSCPPVNGQPAQVAAADFPEHMRQHNAG